MRRPKLGKKPARPGAVKLKLSKYLDVAAIPTPPDQFGHETLVSYWMMLANDKLGCCVFSGGEHETMLWTSEAGAPAVFDDASTVANYSAVTGYNPSDPSTDQGTDMAEAAEYRRTTGLLDAKGNRHKIMAYLAINATDPVELATAMYLFDVVGLGIQFPSQAMTQFDDHQPWDVVAGDTIEGGHYIPLVARRSGMLYCVTWGDLQPMTDNFIKTYADEAIVYLTGENLTGGKTLEGFDLNTLQADLAALGTYQPPQAPTELPPSV